MGRVRERDQAACAHSTEETSMKKLAITFIAIVALASSAFASNAVRISQVYSGGGASTGTPTYNKDYIELFNNSGSPVNIGDWVLEYGSAAGNWGSAAT